MMEMTAVTRINSETSVATEIDGYVIATEPPVAAGGSGLYPPATRMVVAAMLNCSFSEMKAFCIKREIPLEGLELRFHGTVEGGVYTSMNYDVQLPEGFPDKYKESVGRVFDACSVKKIMMNLPEIQVGIV